jgi:YD repeat-containing protein
MKIISKNRILLLVTGALFILNGVSSFAAGNINYHYDAANRLITVQNNATGKAVVYQYDESGNRTQSETSNTNSILVDPDPDGLNAPWTLTGPNAFSVSSNGDAIVENLLPGEYTITWGDVTGWEKPASATASLGAGNSIIFGGTYHLTPLITIPPADGVMGSTITINGSNFGAFQGGGYVDFNGIRGVIISWSDTQITVKVPYGASSGCMRVVTEYGTSACINFVVSNPVCYPAVKVNSDYFDTVQEAYESAAEGNTIRIQAGPFNEDLELYRNITTTLEGVYNCQYEADAGCATVAGSVTISDGTVIINNILIK